MVPNKLAVAKKVYCLRLRVMLIVGELSSQFINFSSNFVGQNVRQLISMVGESFHKKRCFMQMQFLNQVFNDGFSHEVQVIHTRSNVVGQELV